MKKGSEGGTKEGKKEGWNEGSKERQKEERQEETFSLSRSHTKMPRTMLQAFYEFYLSNHAMLVDAILQGPILTLITETERTITWRN